MNETETTQGKTTIALNVLITIARLTALSVTGVSRLASTSGDGVKHLFRRAKPVDGITIQVQDDEVFVDLYVILHKDVNIRDVGRNIQREVARAISEMVGMKVGLINIHVEDIDYLEEDEG